MVAAPDVPKIQDPHYWYWFKPIEQPHFDAGAPDTSKGKLIGGLGDLAGDAIKATDEFMTNYSGDVALAKADPIMDEHQRNLENIYGSLLGSKSQDVLPSSQGYLGTAQMTESAKASGKLSDTYYRAKLAMAAKDGRAQLPSGYRPAFDRKFSEVTQNPIANEYFASMRNDINSFLGQGIAQRNHIDAMFRTLIQGGDEPAAAMHEQFMAGKMTIPNAEKYIASRNANKFQADQLKTQLEAAQSQEGLLKIQANKYASFIVSDAVKNFLDVRDAQWDPDQDKQLDFKHSDKEAQIYGAHLHDLENRARTEAHAALTRPMKELGGRSLLQAGVDEKSVVDSALTRLTLEQEGITNKDFGYGQRLARLKKGLEEDNDWHFNTAPGLGLDVQKINTQHRNLPAPFFDSISKQWLGTPFINKVQTWGVMDYLNAGTIKPGDPDPWTITDTLDKSMKEIGKQSPDFYRMSLGTKVYGGLFSDASPEGKQSFMEHFYGPKNSNFIDKIATKDQFDVFDLLAQPKATEEVFRHGTPKNKQDYVNWFDGTFHKLLGSSFKDLTKAEDNPNLKVHYNDKTNQISVSLHREDGRVISDDILRDDPKRLAGFTKKGPFGDEAILSPNAMVKLRTILSNVNRGLVNLTGLAKELGGEDVGAFVIRALKEHGFDPTSDKVEGIPGKVIRAIAATKPPEPPPAAAGAGEE